jgi:hypothetical protein
MAVSARRRRRKQTPPSLVEGLGQFLVTSANACSQSGHPHFIPRRRLNVKRLFMHNPLVPFAFKSWSMK